MGGKTVYVALCCLGEDRELIHTINSIFVAAENPETIYVGVAMIGKKDFYEFVKSKFTHMPNIRFSYNNLQNNYGTGSGRILSNELYNGEDYYLQIDAHSRLTAKWNTYLINKFEEAKKLVNNKKVILSGLPGRYFYTNNDDHEPFPIEATLVLQYPEWIPNKYILENEQQIPLWNPTHPKQISNKLMKQIELTGFAPLSKVSGAIIFSDSFFAENIYMNKKYLIFEEETLQSVDLIANGFTLMYPGLHCPVLHLYGSDIKNNKGRRDGSKFIIEEIKITEDEYFQIMANNFIEYKEKNKNSVAKFEKYNNIDFIKGASSRKTYPKEYANIGCLPI